MLESELGVYVEKAKRLSVRSCPADIGRCPCADLHTLRSHHPEPHEPTICVRGWTSFEYISFMNLFTCVHVRVCVSQEELLGRVESDRAREALRQARAKEDADALAATKEHLENSEAMVAAYVCRDCPSAPRATFIYSLSVFLCVEASCKVVACTPLCIASAPHMCRSVAAG